MRRSVEYVILALVALGAAGIGAGIALYLAYPVQVGTVAGAVRSTLMSLNAPPGTVTTEQISAYKAPAAPSQPPAGAGDWPSYNKTLTTERYSGLSQID